MFVLRVFCCKVKILSFSVHSVRQKVIINSETINHSLFFFSSLGKWCIKNWLTLKTQSIDLLVANGGLYL